MIDVPRQTDLDQLSDVISTARLDVWDYVTALIILTVAVAAGQAIRVVIRRLVDRSRADNLLGDLVGRIVNYLIVIFGFVYALDTLGIALGPILGALGIVGIALAFAFQDILENFVAGIILQLQRPFASGDEIIVAEHEGRILSVDTRTITVVTPDGETVRIPSAAVIKNPIVNHTQRGRRRTTVDVGVAYGTDLELATRVLREAVEEVDGVLKSPLPEVLIHTFGDSSVDMAVRYWHEPSISGMWRTRDVVAKTISETLAANDITIPFPQRVLHIPGNRNDADEEPAIDAIGD